MALTVRPVAESEVGRAPGDLAQPVASVVRDGRLHSYDDPEVARLSRGDRVVCIEDVHHGRRGGLTGGPGGGAGGEPG